MKTLLIVLLVMVSCRKIEVKKNESANSPYPTTKEMARHTANVWSDAEILIGCSCPGWGSVSINIGIGVNAIHIPDSIFKP